MKSPDPAAPASGFAWEAEQRFALFFVGFLLLSLLAHAFAFFLFQVTYPQKVTIPPPEAQVSVLNPDIPEHRAILAWVAAEDPALSGAISRAKPPGLGGFPYRPSYDSSKAWPKSVPQISEPVLLPPGRSGLALIESVTPASEENAPPLKDSKTSISVSGDLAARPLISSATFTTRSTEPLEGVTFLVGVGPDGTVRHTMLQRSSGSHDVDGRVASRITQMRFQPSDGPVTWGHLTITWGDDAFRKAGEAANTTPGSR